MAIQGMPARGDAGIGEFDAKLHKSSEKLLPGAASAALGAKMIALAPRGSQWPEDSGPGIGPARGLMLGLAVGLLMWGGIIMLLWRFFGRSA